MAGLRKRFKRFGVTRIFTSDLVRCRDTAALLAPGLPVSVSKSLREMNFGAWEGKTVRQCHRSHRRRFEAWMQNPSNVTAPRGESLGALSRRARSFVSRAVRRHPGDTLAFVTHGGVIRTLLSSKPGDFWNFSVPTGAIIEHQWKGGRR